MRPGDLVLFSSDTSFTRMFVRFTHVGVIVDENRVIEMHRAGDRGTEHLRNYFEGGRPTGPKLYDLRARIAAYPGRVWIAPLIRSSPPKMDLSRYRDLEFDDAYVLRYLRSCVADRWFGLADRWFGLAGLGNRKPPTSVFCAEFVGMVLRDAAGIDIDARCLTPCSLASLPPFGAPERVTCFVEHGPYVRDRRSAWGKRSSR